MLLPRFTAALIAAATTLAIGLAGTLARTDHPMIDEIALRHYAARGERTRVDAEIARLTRLDPHWRVPDDLWSANRAHADEDDLWDTLDTAGPEAARAAIAARMAAGGGWSPSEGLMRAVEARAARLAIGAAVRAGRWREAAAVADRRPEAIDPRDAETRWAIARAFARLGRKDEASGLLRTLFNDPRSSDEERRATIHLAMAETGMADVDILVASLAGRPAALAPIAVDITRGRIAAHLRGEPAKTPDAAALAAFSEQARRAAGPDDAGLMAWRAFALREDSTALEWFRLALGKGGDAMAAHGLAHTLRRLGERREAEEIAFAWRDRLANNAILFIDLLEVELTRPRPPLIEPERLARYARVTTETASGEGAQALAWYAFNTCQHEAALAWFARATAWFPKEATVVGYAQTLRRLNRRREFNEVVNRFDGLFPRVVALIWGEDEPGPPSACDPAPSLQQAQFVRPQRRQPPQGFPMAVQAENPLRFASPAAPALVGTDLYRASATRLAPLAARRVLGVTAMPYERDGFVLLAAYDGTTGPAAIAHSRLQAPAGTLWAEEERDTGSLARAPVVEAGRFRTPMRQNGDRP